MHDPAVSKTRMMTRTVLSPAGPIYELLGASRPQTRWLCPLGGHHELHKALGERGLTRWM